MSGGDPYGGMGPIMPSGMPPGTSYEQEGHAPEGVIYFRIYAVLLATMSLLITLGGGWSIFSPFFAPHPSAPVGELGMWIIGVFWGGVGLLMLVPTLFALLGGRRRWVHTLGTLVIVAGMLGICCIPVLIPLLIVWTKPETARWFDGSV